MSFQLEGTAHDLDVAPRAGERAQFQRGDVEVTIEIDVDAQGRATSDCLLIARTAREVSNDVYRQLEERTSWLRLPESQPSSWPRGSGGGRVVPESEGRWILHGPEAVVRLCDDIRSELHAEAARLAQLLRWLYNRPRTASPLTRQRLNWSLDGSDWHEPPGRGIEVPVFGGDAIELAERDIEFVAQIWGAGEVIEPVARQILLEAVELADENPRAALVLAVAAAQIGVKQFAAESAAKSEAWLINNLQSPPIPQLLKHYLPLLTHKRTDHRRDVVPMHVHSQVDKAMQERNKIVHEGVTGWDEERLLPLLAAVNDLLYLLDWFAGNDWAFEHLQEETQQAYGGKTGNGDDRGSRT